MKRFLSISVAFHMFLVASAPAAVIYSGLQNITIPNDFEGVYLNILTGQSTATQPGTWNNAPMINPFFGGTAIATSDFLRPVITGTDQIENLAYSTIVGPGSSFASGESGSSTHVGGSLNQFLLGVEGYIGYAFQTSIGGPTMYGVMRVTLDNDGSGATIHDWSYDDTGAPVSVPEPKRTLILAAGLLCVARRRRRSCPPSEP
ncbi:MAG TPA: hypothetical protein VGE39_07680 [Prosthecobacter sp.]